MTAKQTIPRVTRAAAAALAFAALAAPPAVAGHQDLGTQSALELMKLELMNQSKPSHVRPDDRAMRPSLDARQPNGAGAVSVRPDDRAIRPGLKAAQQDAADAVTPTAAIGQIATDGFDWRDAAIGAGLAGVLLASGLVFVRHGRSRMRPGTVKVS
jgi:hypothetical protein